MHAIVFCNTHAPLPATMTDNHEYVLLPVLNRPLAWHLIEQCARAGATRITLVAEANPDTLRTQLDHGQRWGVEVTVTTPVGTHSATTTALARPEEDTLVLPGCWLYPPEMLAAFTGRGDASPLFASTAPASPQTPPSQTVVPHAGASMPCPHMQATTTARPTDSSTAVAPSAPPPCLIRRAATHSVSARPQQAQEDSTARRKHLCAECGRLLHTLEDIHQASMDGLTGDMPWLTRQERETQPGIRMGHHATIHPSAKIIPPVIIGSYASIEAGCTIGPYAVIGDGCVIDHEAELTYSVIDTASYAGPLTFREHSLSLQNMLIHIPTGQCVLVPDDFLQGGVEQPANTGRALMHRGVALVLALLLAPVLLVLWLGGGGRFPTRAIAGKNRSQTLDCTLAPPAITIRMAHASGTVLRHLPAVLDVITGRLALVGPQPMAPETAARLAEEWEKLQLAVDPGFFPPWAGLAPAPLADEERSGINAWYARHAGIGTDIRILLGLLRHGWGHLRSG